MPVAAVDRSTCSGRAAASEADDSAYPTRYVLAPSTGSHLSVTDWHVEPALTTCAGASSGADGLGVAGAAAEMAASMEAEAVAGGGGGRRRSFIGG